MIKVISKLFFATIFAAIFALDCIASSSGKSASTSQSEGSDVFSIENLKDSTVYASIDKYKVTGADIKKESSKIAESLGMYAQIFPEEMLFYMTASSLIEKHAFSKEIKAKGIEKDKDVQEKIADSRQAILRGILVQRYIDKNLNQAYINSSYDKFKKEFIKNKTPGEQEIKVAHILVKDEATADRLYEELKNGADFSKLANEKSLDTATSGKGGLLNQHFRKNSKSLMKRFIDAAFAIFKIGSHSKVKTKYGWHIIKLIDKKPVKVPSLESVRKQITQQANISLMSDYSDQIIGKNSKFLKPDGKTSTDPKKEMKRLQNDLRKMMEQRLDQ